MRKRRTEMFKLLYKNAGCNRPDIEQLFSLQTNIFILFNNFFSKMPGWNDLKKEEEEYDRKDTEKEKKLQKRRQK